MTDFADRKLVVPNQTQSNPVALRSIDGSALKQAAEKVLPPEQGKEQQPPKREERSWKADNSPTANTRVESVSIVRTQGGNVYLISDDKTPNGNQIKFEVSSGDRARLLKDVLKLSEDGNSTSPPPVTKGDKVLGFMTNKYQEYTLNRPLIIRFGTENRSSDRDPLPADRYEQGGKHVVFYTNSVTVIGEGTKRK